MHIPQSSIPLTLVLLLWMSGCGYTALKRGPAPADPYTQKMRDERKLSEQRVRSLYNNWHGVIITRLNGIVKTADSIAAFTVDSDGTWSLRNRRGIFRGEWTFTDGRPSFHFDISCECPDRDFTKHFAGYFRDWGVQFYSTGERIHSIDVEWQLKPGIATNGLR